MSEATFHERQAAASLRLERLLVALAILALIAARKALTTGEGLEEHIREFSTAFADVQ